MRICGLVSAILQSCPAFCEEGTTDESDPIVTKIMEIMNKSSDFHDILERNPELQQNVKIHSLTQKECQEQGIKHASFTYTPSTMFSHENIDIYFDRSLPLSKQLRGVLIEYCNATFVKDYAKLDRFVAEGKLDRERYIYFKEQIEWKAAHQAFKIAEAIDALNLFENETIFSDLGKKANKNFDLYLQIQTASGHSARYGEIWDTINRNRTY